MRVGCVKEIKNNEYRVGLTPTSVSAYVFNNHEVFIEKGAGLGSGFTDEEYRQAGAKILTTAKEVWDISEMIIKVKEPLKEEYSLIKKNQILFTYLHLAADRGLLDALLESECSAFAYETVRDYNGTLPLLKPMSEVAGRLSIQGGARSLEKPSGGLGVLLSGLPGVPKANVVILGAGVVGTNACQIAVGMGANVTVIDININRLTELEERFDHKIQTLYSQDHTIREALKSADLVIGSVLIPGKAAPKLIKREYLKEMKPGSVIVDVAIDQGGCCETSRPTYYSNPTFVVDNVVHYCVVNMPSAVPRTSTISLSNATLQYGLTIANNNTLDSLNIIPGLKSGLNTYQGKLVSREVAESFNLSYETLM